MFIFILWELLYEFRYFSHLQEKLEPTHSAPPSPMDTSGAGHVPGAAHAERETPMAHSAPAGGIVPNSGAPSDLFSRFPTNDASSLTRHIQHLRNEVARLKQQLKNAQTESESITLLLIWFF